MATVNFLYRSKRPEAPLTLRLLFRLHGKDYVLSAKTNLKVSRSYWKKDHKTRSKDVQVRNRQIEVNNEIQKIEAFMLSKVQSIGIENMTSKRLKDLIDGYYNPSLGATQKEGLTEAIQEIIDTAEHRENGTGGVGLSKNRIKAYGQLKRIVQEFEDGKPPYKIKDVNLNFAKEIKRFLFDKKNYAPVTALKYLSDIKSVCFDAEKNGVEVSPQLRFIKSKTVKTEYIIYLTPDEIRALKKLKLQAAYLENARRWLLLGCSIGQRVSDLLNVTKSNFKIRNGLHIIEITQQKTGRLVTIPVLPETKEILELGLPYKIADQNFNNYIKEVCRIAGIDTPTKGLKMNTQTKRKEEGVYPKWQLIASHVCRRSFATNLYGKLPTPLIMSITGHTTEKSFLGYIGKSSMDYAQQIADYYTLQVQKEKSPLKLIKSKAGGID